MTPLKETLEVGEASVSQGTNRPKPGSGQLRSDAVSLDVPVKVHGSRVVEVVRGTTPHTEPFEEQTNTMIVFPLGGVVKMTTQVNVGQAIVLTNLKTRQDAICRVVKTRTNPNLHSYVEVEFSHPQPGYWGVHFPSDGPEPPKKAASPTASASVAPAPTASAPTAPAISTPLPKIEIPKVEIKEQKAAPVAPVAPATTPAPPKAEAAESASFSLEQLRGGIGAASATPLASSQQVEEAGARKTEAQSEPESSAMNEPASHAASTFGRFAARAASSGEPAAAHPDFGAGLEYSPLGASAEKAQKQGKNWVLIAACIGLLVAAAAGGGFYFHHKRLATQPVAVTAPAVPEVPIAAPASSDTTAAIAAPVEATPSAAMPSAAAPTSAPVATPPVTTHIREPEPGKASKPVPSESVQSRSESKTPESAKQKSAAVVPDMFGALNAHPTTAVHSSNGESGAAPSINAGALPDGQSIALPSTEPSPENLAPPPPAPQAAAEEPIPVGGQIKAPQPISSPAVAYPQMARQAGVEGNVVVRIVIDKTGNVTEARALSGPLLLRDAAVDALRQRKYAPTKLDGHPISVEMLVTIQFRR